MVMAGGEMCLLLPNVSMNFSEKICQARRRAVPKCLFGPPDHAENKRLLEEFLQKERERAKKRWGVDLDELEAAIEKAAKKEKCEIIKMTEESRIPQFSAEVEERLSPSGLEDREEKTSRNSSCPVAPLRRSAICNKPCSKFQKRVRATGNLKRQTHLTAHNGGEIASCVIAYNGGEDECAEEERAWVREAAAPAASQPLRVRRAVLRWHKDFWRARKSVSFVFGKNKSRTISLQSLKDLLEPQPPKLD